MVEGEERRVYYEGPERRKVTAGNRPAYKRHSGEYPNDTPLLLEFLEKNFEDFKQSVNASFGIIANKIDCINGVRKDIARIDKDIGRGEKWITKMAVTLIFVLVFLAAYHGKEFITMIWH